MTPASGRRDCLDCLATTARRERGAFPECRALTVSRVCPEPRASRVRRAEPGPAAATARPVPGGNLERPASRVTRGRQAEKARLETLGPLAGMDCQESQDTLDFKGLKESEATVDSRDFRGLLEDQAFRVNVETSATQVFLARREIGLCEAFKATTAFQG